MQLDDSQIIDLVKSRPNASLIAKGKNYESLLKVVTEPLFSDELESETGWDAIKETMSLPLTDEKYLRCLDFVRLPLPIVNISEDVVADINKVFEARNANFETIYPRKSSQEEVGDRILLNINVRKFIERNGKKVFKNKPNSFVVVDKNSTGEPFLIFLTNDRLRGIEFEQDQETVKYIMFLHSVHKDASGKSFELISFYDDTHYRVLELQDGNYTILSQNEHNLGYCPATPFLNRTLNSSNIFDRYSPLARVLATMVDWTDFDIYNRFYEHYGVFPIAEQPKPVCNNDKCTDGTINDRDEEGNALVSKCPTCSKSPFLGPGSIYLVDPASRKDEEDVFGKLRYVSPPIENLTKSKEYQKERVGFIKVNVTGVNNVITKEAVNADQIKAVMEDRRKPLLFLAGMLNDLDTWIVTTVIKLGMNVDVKRHSNYGTEWFLLTELEIQTLFEGAKRVGLPEGVLDLYYRLLIETQYKNDPHTVRKLVIENNLNPAPYKNMAEVYEMKANSAISQESVIIKANITALIEQFERENGSIVEFGQDEIISGRWTFADKIDTIINEFKIYIKDEQIGIEQEVRPNDAGQQGENQSG